MKCERCFHKPICEHYSNIRNDTYARIGYEFSPDECKDYFDITNVAPVVQGHVTWRKRHKGGFITRKCLGDSGNSIFTPSCNKIAKIDDRCTVSLPYCSVCGKLLGDFLNYCPNCGAKMDLKESESNE